MEARQREEREVVWAGGAGQRLQRGDLAHLGDWWKSTETQRARLWACAADRQIKTHKLITEQGDRRRVCFSSFMRWPFERRRMAHWFGPGCGTISPRLSKHRWPRAPSLTTAVVWLFQSATRRVNRPTTSNHNNKVCCCQDTFPALPRHPWAPYRTHNAHMGARWWTSNPPPSSLPRTPPGKSG